MSKSTDGNDISYKAAGDLSAKQYYVMRISAADTVNTAATNTSQVPVGILQNDPAAANEEATVRQAGTSQVVAGDAIASAGTMLTFDSSGRVITQTNGNQYRVGVNKEVATAANEIIEVVLVGLGHKES